jgi:hypothetical protein
MGACISSLPVGGLPLTMPCNIIGAGSEPRSVSPVRIEDMRPYDVQLATCSEARHDFQGAAHPAVTRAKTSLA